MTKTIEPMVVDLPCFHLTPTVSSKPRIFPRDFRAAFTPDGISGSKAPPGPL